MIPVIDFLRTKPKTLDDLPEKERLRIIVKISLLGTLAWDYADTVLDIARQMKIPQMKKVSRAVSELRREYDRYNGSFLSSDDCTHMKRLSDLFADINDTAFNRLCYGLDTELGRIDRFDPQNAYLIKAVQMTMTVIDTMKLFADESDAWMEAHGVDGHTVMPKHFGPLAILIPQYAGDCYDPHSEARRITAGILLNEIKKIELYDENGIV